MMINQFRFNYNKVIYFFHYKDVKIDLKNANLHNFIRKSGFYDK